MRTDLKAVLFDIDDTLFDRNRAQGEIVHLIVQTFRGLFTGIEEERIANAFFESDRVGREAFDAGGSIDAARIGRSRAFLKTLGLSEDLADKITAMYVRSYPAVNAPVRGAACVVRDLAEAFQLGIISNGSPDVQYRKLKTLGIKHLFDCILLSEEVGMRKPDPEIFWRAAVSLARKPEECLHVGDSYESDVLGAKKAGMLACWFNPHGVRRSQVDIKPDCEIGALDEILGILGCV